MMQAQTQLEQQDKERAEKERWWMGAILAHRLRRCLTQRVHPLKQRHYELKQQRRLRQQRHYEQRQQHGSLQNG
jgi:hypothetical protein